MLIILSIIVVVGCLVFAVLLSLLLCLLILSISIIFICKSFAFLLLLLNPFFVFSIDYDSSSFLVEIASFLN